MQVNLYTFSKRENSTKQPTASTATAFTCVLKDASGVLAPTIKLDPTIGNPRSYNYAYIADFGRYYYVRDWTYYRGEWEASLEVDVLASWKTQIGSATLYILRSAKSSLWNKYVNDEKYPMKSYVINRYNVAASTPWNGATVVLGVIGDASHDQTMGAVNYYALTTTQTETLFNWLFGNTGGYTDALDTVFSYTFDEVFRASVDPMKYIVSARYFPFDITSSYVSQTSMVIGKIPKTLGPGINNLRLLTPMPTQILTPITIAVPTHDQVASRGDYLMAAPYSHFMLEFEPYGNIEIDGGMLEPGGSITCTPIVDLITGQSLLYLSATGPSGAVVEMGTYKGEVGANIQLAQMTTNFFQNLKTDLEKAANSGLSENFFGSVDAAIGTITDTRYQLSSAGCNGSILPYAIHNPVLHLNFRPVVDADPTLFGYPVCKASTISSAGAYMICATGDVAFAGTSEEHRAVASFLTSGFFYE